MIIKVNEKKLYWMSCHFMNCTCTQESNTDPLIQIRNVSALFNGRLWRAINALPTCSLIETCDNF